VSILSILAEEAGLLAKALPFPVVEALANDLLQLDPSGIAGSRSRLIERITHPHYRGIVAKFFDAWRLKAAQVTPQMIAAALLSTAFLEKSHREGESVELVWTGPDVGAGPLRHTEQALLEVISNANRRLTVVSYAVYNIPDICKALLTAADRGVAINIVVESPDRIEGQNAYSTLAQFGLTVTKRCGVYLWPSDKREVGDNGKPGILHVKCAVADGTILFLSSANLTEQAFKINMELGLLLRGGDVPKQVESLFDRLIEAGTLVRA